MAAAGRLAWTGLVMSVAGSALWAAIDQHASDVATAAVHAPGWLVYVAVGPAAVAGSVALAYLLGQTDVVVGTSTSYLENLGEIVLAGAVSICAASVPIGLYSTLQVATGSRLGGGVFEVLAYLPIGVTVAAVVLATWAPVLITFGALDEKIEKLEAAAAPKR